MAERPNRRGLQRANTAVAGVIVTVLALALAAMWQSRRAADLQASAERSRQRAEQAESQALQDLWRALVAEARATRLGQSLGRREEGLETIRRAAAIASSADLRNEAIATLALPDFRIESRVPIDGSMRSITFDDTLGLSAVALTNGSVLVRRTVDGTEVHRLVRAAAGVPEAHGVPVNLTFAPDSRALSVRYARGALAVFDLTTGQVRFTRDTDTARRPASRGLFSSDSRHLVAPVFTPDGFEVMDAVTGATVAHFPKISSYHHAAVRPGTNQFVAYSEGVVYLIDWDRRAVVLEHPYPDGSRVMAWNRDGTRLAIGGGAPRVQVLELASRRVVELSGHKGDVFDLHFDATGDRLAAITSGSATRIWDLRDGQAVATSEDRRLARWGANGLTGWVVPQRHLEVRREANNPSFVTLRASPTDSDGSTMDVSPDGAWAATLGEPDAVLLWDLSGRRHPARVVLTNLQSLCFHPRQPSLVVLRDYGIEEHRLRDTADGQPGFEGAPVLVPAPSGKRPDLVTASADGGTRAYVERSSGSIWVENMAARTAPVRLEKILHSSVLRSSGSAHGTGSLALSPNGRWLVVAADGGWGAYLFDARTGQPVREVDPNTGGVQFSLDGRWLVLAAAPYCRVFRTADWSVAWTKPMDADRPSYTGSAAFSPDGSQVACVLSANQVTLAMVSDGRELALLESPEGAIITRARWTPDGSRLVLATRENYLNIWQPVALNRELASLGLAWDAPFKALSRDPMAAVSPARPSHEWMVPTLFICAAAVAGVALVALRHHRLLVDEFAQAEALAHRREQELHMERELGDLKSRFVAMVSHEFRTPLGITMSAVELLRHHLELLPETKRQELLTDIFESTRHMAGLMEQVLLLGRFEAGKLAFRPVRTDLAALGHKLVDESLSATHHRCPIRLVVEPAALGEGAVDESLLRHMIGNLLSNAVKYSPAGSPVDLTMAREQASAVFAVCDRGIGIPEADLAKLFQAFHRGGNVGETQGTGLGLVIVKRCVDLHGGTIRVDSVPGQGTTFTVRLPAFAIEGAP